MSTATLSRTGLAFRVEPKPFAAACDWVARRIPSRLFTPILAGILLEVADGQLTLSSFDYDVSARATIEVTGAIDGRALVSGRLLAGVAKTFPDKPVTVSIDGNHLAVTCGSVNLRLPLMPVEDYPALPDQPPLIGAIGADVFATAVGRVAPTVNPNNPTVEITGIHLRIDGARFDVEGTDRYRAAIATCSWQPTGADVEATALVPFAALVDAAKTFDHDTVSIGLSEDGVIGFATPGRSITVRLLTHKYVPVPKLFPERAGQPTSVQVSDFSAALKRAVLVHAATSPVRLSFTAGSVVAQANDGKDTAIGEAIDCEHHGDDIAVALNPQYLLDALAALRADTAELHITHPYRPVLITAPDDPHYRHLMVPIRER